MGGSLNMRLVIVAATLSLLAFNGFAGWFGFGGTSWKEEVLLHDGTKLVVERSVRRGGPHEIGQSGSYTKETLTFTHPVSGKLITWEDNATPELRTSNFLPMALDVYRDDAYLVASPMGCLSYNKWGRPNPPYVVFRYGGQRWMQISLADLPQEISTPNLLFSAPDDEVERLGRQYVTIQDVKRVIAEYRQPEFRSILRVPQAARADSGLVGCEELVYYKGAWVGPGDSIGKRMMDGIKK